VYRPYYRPQCPRLSTRTKTFQLVTKDRLRVADPLAKSGNDSLTAVSRSIPERFQCGFFQKTVIPEAKLHKQDFLGVGNELVSTMRSLLFVACVMLCLVPSSDAFGSVCNYAACQYAVCIRTPANANNLRRTNNHPSTDAEVLCQTKCFVCRRPGHQDSVKISPCSEATTAWIASVGRRGQWDEEWAVKTM